MNSGQSLHLVTEGVMLAALVGGPFLMACLITGVIVSVFQAVTQIQEATLSFVPKLIVIVAVGAAMSNWMLSSLVQFLNHSLTMMSNG